MLKVVGLLSVALAAAPVAVAQEVVDRDLFEQGQRLYSDHCAFCHGESGEGNAPTFPALSGNDRLENSALVANNIRKGAGNMPPFPALTAEQVTSLTEYVRNAWTNDFGSAGGEETTAALEGQEEGRSASVWDGVFTEAQVERGEAAYTGSCGRCHGRKLNGAPDDPDMLSTPPLARAKFLRVWEGRSLATLFDYTRATMPESNPGSLSDEEYVDIIAYMLSVGGMPAGGDELRPDPQGLARVVIEQQPPD